MTHPLLALLAQGSGSNQAGGSLLGLLLPLLLMGGVFYFLLIRPQRAQRQRQQSILNALEVGDEVMTAGGIFGTITDIDQDQDILTVEIAPGTRVRMVRRAISQRITQDEDDEEYDESEDEAPGEEAEPRP